MSKVVNLADIRFVRQLTKQHVLAKVRELAAQVPADLSDEERAEYLDEIALMIAEVDKAMLTAARPRDRGGRPRRDGGITAAGTIGLVRYLNQIAEGLEALAPARFK